MSVNNVDVAKILPNNVGFWEVGGYKPNVNRIREGFNQLEDVTKMLKERVDIEDRYGKTLQNWNQKWKSYVEKNFHNCTITNSLKDVFLEGKELSRLHLAVKDRLSDEVLKTIGAFKDSSYHRSAIRGLKEQKDIEEKFEKAQHRWRKLWKKLETAKKHYHNCCRAEKSSYIQMVNSQADLSASVAADSSEKSRDRHEKCREETKKARSVYEQQLKNISYENTAYVDKMSCVFEECQQFEFIRTKFLLEMISGIQKVFVDLVAPPKLLSIHSNLEAKFKSIGDTQLKEDLKAWSSCYGTDVPHQLPVFEKYSPEIHNITSKMEEPQQHGGVILTKKKLLKSESDFQTLGYDNYQNDFQRHNSMDDVSPNIMSTGINHCHVESNTSMSIQDIYRAGLGPADYSFRPPNRHSPSSKFYLNHKTAVAENKLYSNSIEVLAVQNDLDTTDNKTLSILDSFITAKTSLADPLIDPFPMPTPNKMSVNCTSDITNSIRQQAAKPPPYHVYTAEKSKAKKVDSHNCVQEMHEALSVDMNEPIDPITARDVQMGEMFSKKLREGSNISKSDGTQNPNSGSLSISSAASADTTKENLRPQNEPDDNSCETKHGMSDTSCVQYPTFRSEKVRVIFDYNPNENDELALVKGELIEMYRPADDMGWCYGRKKDKVGFFPAGYVAKLQ